MYLEDRYIFKPLQIIHNTYFSHEGSARKHPFPNDRQLGTVKQDQNVFRNYFSLINTNGKNILIVYDAKGTFLK